MSAAFQQSPTPRPAGPPVALPLYHRSCRPGGGPERKVFDQDYIRRLGQGDRETETHFYNYFGPLLLMKLRARLRSPQLVEDARQETFLRVLHAVRGGTVQQPERFGGFVNSVCEHVVSESFRAGSRFQQVPENAIEPADQTASAEMQCLSDERKGMIRRVLTELSRPDQQILRKLFLEEQDKDQICQEMGIDRDYLRVRLHRALARLRTTLQKQTATLSKGNSAIG